MRISTISVGVQECEGMARESGAGQAMPICRCAPIYAWIW